MTDNNSNKNKLYYQGAIIVLIILLNIAVLFSINIPLPCVWIGNMVLLIAIMYLLGKSKRPEHLGKDMLPGKDNSIYKLLLKSNIIKANDGIEPNTFIFNTETASSKHELSIALKKIKDEEGLLTGDNIYEILDLWDLLMSKPKFPILITELNKYSLSRFQMAIWTIVILSAIVTSAVWNLSLIQKNKTILANEIPENSLIKLVKASILKNVTKEEVNGLVYNLFRKGDDIAIDMSNPGMELFRKVKERKIDGTVSYFFKDEMLVIKRNAFEVKLDALDSQVIKDNRKRILRAWDNQPSPEYLFNKHFVKNIKDIEGLYKKLEKYNLVSETEDKLSISLLWQENGISNAVNSRLDPQLLWLMGISIGSLTMATLVSSQKRGNLDTNNSTPPVKPGLQDFVVGANDGEIKAPLDLSRIQMLLISLVIIAIYCAMLSAMFSGVAQHNEVITSLPKFSGDIIVLLAISHGGYLSVKQIDVTKKNKEHEDS